MVERLNQLTVKHLAIFGLLLLTAVILTVIGFSLLKIIKPLSGWVYVGLSVIAFLALVVIFIYPDYIEANIPGFGHVGVGGPDSTKQQLGREVIGRSSPHPNNFEEYAELTREVSPKLSTQLYRIQQAYSDPLEATSAIISAGMEVDDKNPVQETIEILEADLEARDFIRNSENHDMTVVNIDGDRVITRLDDDQHPPKSGLEFKLFTNTAVDVGGTTETFPDWVGTVRVEEVEDPLCIMRVISWDEELSDDPSQRNADLTRSGAWVEIGLDGAESIDWETIEETHEKLTSLQEQGELNYAN